jgi:hypothetical protein
MLILSLNRVYDKDDKENHKGVNYQVGMKGLHDDLFAIESLFGKDLRVNDNFRDIRDGMNGDELGFTHYVKERISKLESQIKKSSSDQKEEMIIRSRDYTENGFKILFQCRYEIEKLKTLSILRGSLELIETKTFISETDTPYLCNFLTILGQKGKLDRDNPGSGMGFHYHYCKKNGERSDTLITVSVIPKNNVSKPLVWERHSESNAKFRAKANTWGKGKRLSVYNACTPDLKKWPISYFKRPSLKAKPLWPY